MAEVKSHKVKQLSSRLDPNAIYWVQASANLPIEGFITDINGVPYPLKDLQGTNGITGLTNTDGNLVITGADNKVINLAPALLSVINSALQSGDNISELINDVGYITDLEEKVVNEIPTGVLNGVNSTFTTQFGVKPDSEEVYVNGNRQKKPDDYNISGQIINLTFSPQSTESILIDYIKQ